MPKKLPTVNIKGKEYVLVVDRIKEFNSLYPNGSIKTQRLTTTIGYEVVQATICPDVKNPDRVFQGLSQGDTKSGPVNSMAALENAETSAVGRALGMMGIGVIESIASADEMHKVGISESISEEVEEDLGLCSKCHAKNARSKTTGNVYCSAMCWKKPPISSPKELLDIF